MTGRELGDGGEAGERGDGVEDYREKIRAKYHEVGGEGEPGAAEVAEKLQVPEGQSKPDKLAGDSQIVDGELERFRERVKREYPVGAEATVDRPAERASENRDAEVSTYENEEEFFAEQEERQRELEERQRELEDGDPKAVDSRAARADGSGELAREGGANEGRANVEKMRDNPESAREPGIERKQEHLATFEAVAQRRDDGRTAFEVRKDGSESQAGFKLEQDKVYSIDWAIEGIGRFQKTYSPVESERIALIAPKEYADSIEPGSRHKINITSIREVSKTEEHLAVFTATAYQMEDGRIRFDVLKDTFEERTGVHLGDGKMRQIGGTIDHDIEFKLTQSGEKSAHLFIFAPKEATQKLQPGEKYDITVKSIEEKRIFTVPESEAVTRLILQKRALESAGIDVDGMKNAGEGDKVVKVVELMMRNLSHEGEAPKKLFAKVNTNEGAVVLNIGRAGAKGGDAMELMHARQYSNERFAKDFNEHRGKETKNTRLIAEGEKLEMEIDGKRFEMKGTLKVQNLQVFMSGEMYPFKRDIRFWFDGETITPKFGQSWQIRSFAANEKGMEMTYTAGKRTITTRSELRFLREDRPDMTRISEGVHLFGENPKTEGWHGMEIDDSIYAEIYGRISRAMESDTLYFLERGRWGEDLGEAMFSKLGWELVARHPFDSGDDSKETYLGGTDMLFRNLSTEELFIVEFKWQQDSQSALKEGIKEVKRRRGHEEPNTAWGHISGAYVLSIDLDVRSTKGEFVVKRAW